MKIPSADEHAPVAQRDVGRVADVDAVDEDHAAALGLAEARAALVDLERQPVLALEDPVAADADRLGELAVQVDALVVAVERHHVARAHEVEHQLELLRVAVAGGVDRRVAGRDHVAADVVEPVDRLVDGALVARDRRGREDDRVALVQLDLRVVAVGHAAQRAQRLALGPGRDDHELLVGPVVELARLDERSPRARRCARASGRCSRSCASSGRRARPCGRAPRRRRRPAGRGGCSRRSTSRRSGPRSA